MSSYLVYPQKRLCSLNYFCGLTHHEKLRPSGFLWDPGGLSSRGGNLFVWAL